MTRRYSLASALLAWYDRERRGLAWRDTTDPYEILVSEVMLQQTQVVRVEPAYRAFLNRFPTVAALAAAPLADVLRLWRGLGYNRRAVHLHRAAQGIMTRHGGRIPDDLDALKSLPGVGDYTARAVLAFAFDRPVAPVDTNVARVLSRAVAGRSLARRAVQELADELVPYGRPRDWSQALMDLGARACASRAPRCENCPIRASCAWRLAPGSPDPAARTAGSPRPQGRFAGSDRFHRGRIVDALRAGPVDVADLAQAAGLARDPDRTARLLDRLVADGLVQRRGDLLRLGGSVE